MFFVGGRAGAQRAGRQAVGPAVSPAPAFHGRSAHQPKWPKGLRATPPPSSAIALRGDWKYWYMGP